MRVRGVPRSSSSATTMFQPATAGVPHHSKSRGGTNAAGHTLQNTDCAHAPVGARIDNGAFNSPGKLALCALQTLAIPPAAARSAAHRRIGPAWLPHSANGVASMQPCCAAAVHVKAAGTFWLQASASTKDGFSRQQESTRCKPAQVRPASIMRLVAAVPPTASVLAVRVAAVRRRSPSKATCQREKLYSLRGNTLPEVAYKTNFRRFRSPSERLSM